MNEQSNSLIFTVCRPRYPDKLNLELHFKVIDKLEQLGIPHKELWHNPYSKLDLSILIKGFEYRNIVQNFCLSYDQESYKELHTDGSLYECYDHSTDPRHKIALGFLRTADKLNEAVLFDPYTQLYFNTFSERGSL